MQQINLYLPEFHPRKEILSFPQMLMAIGGIVLLFVAYGMWQSSNLSIIEQQIAQEKNMLEPLRVQQKELDKLLANRPDEKRVDSDIESLQNEVDLKSKALEVLKGSDISASKGFSLLLEELARNKNKNIWFTDITVKNDVLLIKGQTLDPKLISEWIESTEKQQALGRQFAAIDIQRNENNSRVFEFELSGGVLTSHER